MGGGLVLLPSMAYASRARREGNAWEFVLFCGVFAIASFWRLWKNFRKARSIEDTPTAKVASAAQGEVELSGTAVGVQGKNQVCPMTGASCLWYFFKVERYERAGKHSQWVTISSGQSSDVFGLRDETGMAIIAPMLAEVTSRWHREWRGSSMRPADREEKGGFLSGLGSYRYTEDLILPGDPVYVLGWFETLSGMPSSSIDLSGHLRRLKQNPKELIGRFDANKDGEISGEEWDSARASVEAELRHEADNRPAAPDVHTVHSPPPESGVTYLISSYSPEELAGTYRRRAFLSLVVFLVCGCVVVWFTFLA